MHIKFIEYYLHRQNIKIKGLLVPAGGLFASEGRTFAPPVTAFAASPGAGPVRRACGPLEEQLHP